MPILCAIDFSAASAAATARAARLARASGTRLELVHVIPAGVAGAMARWTRDRHEIAADALLRIERAAAQARARFGCEVAGHVAVGLPHAQIAARAHATAARLVVVGAPSASRTQVLGSTTEALRRALRVPMLVTRRRVQRPDARVLVAVDFSDASASAANAAARLFPTAALHFLHVCNPLFESRHALGDGRPVARRTYRNHALLAAGSDLEAFLRERKLPADRGSSHVKRGSPAACIRQAAAELGASVVALGTPNVSWLAGFMGSVGHGLLRDPGPDVLVARADAQVPVLRRDEAAVPTVEAFG